MMEVPSRPGSSRSMRADEVSQSEESSEDGDEEEEYDEEEEHDARSIRSFESMMSQRSRQARRRKTTSGGRKSIADRLASVPGLSRLSQGQGDGAAKVCRRQRLLVSLVLTVDTRLDIIAPASYKQAVRIANVFEGTLAHLNTHCTSEHAFPSVYRRRYQGV